MIIEAARLHEQAREVGGVSSAIITLLREENVRGIMIDITNMSVEGGVARSSPSTSTMTSGPVHAYITTNLSAAELARVWRGAIQSGAFTESVLRSIASSRSSSDPVVDLGHAGELAQSIIDALFYNLPHPLRGLVWLLNDDPDPFEEEEFGTHYPYLFKKFEEL